MFPEMFDKEKLMELLQEGNKILVNPETEPEMRKTVLVNTLIVESILLGNAEVSLAIH